VTAAALLLSLASATGSPKVDVTKLAEGRYRLVVAKFEGADDRLAQAVVMPTAESLCAPSFVSFEKFNLKVQVIGPKGRKPRAGRFEQEIACVEPAGASAAESGAGFAPTAADEAQARSAALAYFAAKDAGKVEDVLRTLSAGQRQIVDQEQWRKEVRQLPEKLGDRVQRRVVKLSWYIDPAGVPSGVYVAADMAGESAKMAALCGYVAMRRIGNDRYEVVREESGLLERRSAESATAEQLALLRQQLRCVDE
jgi:hypothetical protein